METLRNFLEVSTIHGLSYLSTSKKSQRLIWTFVVLTGFTSAAIMIHAAFENWAESPISTNINTRPISEFRLPKISVCPPKNTFTNLNYDLMTAQNMTLSNETRSMLKDQALQMLSDLTFEEIIKNISLVEESSKYTNWYKGFTEIELPSYVGNDDRRLEKQRNTINFDFILYSLSGNITTQHFGDIYKEKLVERMLYISATFKVPQSLQYSEEYLMINMENVPLIGHEKMCLDYTCSDLKEQILSKSISLKRGDREILFEFSRKITTREIRKFQNIERMPGFTLWWSYSQNTSHSSVWSDSFGGGVWATEFQW